MKNKIKEFFKGYGEIFSAFYDDLAHGTFDEGIGFIQHFIAWAGTAALTMATVSTFSAGLILPGVLLALGTASIATDEAVHLTKKEPSLIVRSISKVVSAVLAPPLFAVFYPIVVAGSAISSAIKGNIAERKARKMAKELNQTKDYTYEYDATAVHETETTVTPIVPTMDTPPTRGPDFSNYHLADEPHSVAGGEHIEELEETPPGLEPPTSDDDPQNVD